MARPRTGDAPAHPGWHLTLALKELTVVIAWFNPIVFAGVLICAGLVAIGVARYLCNISIRPRRYGTMRRFGVILIVIGLLWGADYAFQVPSWNEMRMDVKSNKPIPERFIFVPVVYANNRECLGRERDLCLFVLSRSLPNHQVECLKDPKDLKGSFGEVLKDRAFLVPDEAFILRGEVEYEPLRGTCKISLAKVNRQMVAQGLMFEGSYGCAFREICE